MIKNINNIVIVGGGSAGWMTAAALSNVHPDKNITVIESPNTPIIGVGESTLASINNYLKLIGASKKQFMKNTNATFKMSIRFVDFYEKDSEPFHYPFGKPYTEDMLRGVYDWWVKKAFFPETPVSDFAKSFFPAVTLCEEGKFSDNNGEFDNYDPDNYVAYHFDAVKFGKWLKDTHCNNVNYISQNVEKILQNSNGIDHLVLSNNEKIKADLFVDCTGFKSLLLEDTLQEPFISLNQTTLPNNKAWVAQVPYKDKDKEMMPYTNCTAIENGWCWNIGVWDRLGTGYVYSDQFITDKEALEEYKNYLKSNKMIIPRTDEEINSLTFRNISMKVGYHKRTLVKNVVAIGLSAGFAEPLESNGLFTVHENIFMLLKLLRRNAITQWDRDNYNAATYDMWRNFTQFIGLHYALSIRDDTPYWRANSQRVYKPGLDSLEPDTSNGYNTFKNQRMFNNTPIDTEAGIVWVSTGMNTPMLDEIDVALISKLDYNDLYSEYKDVFNIFEQRKQKWKFAAKDKPSLYQYLKEVIYNETDQ